MPYGKLNLVQHIPEQDLLVQLEQQRGGPEGGQVELVHCKELLQETLHGSGEQVLNFRPVNQNKIQHRFLLKLLGSGIL